MLNIKENCLKSLPAIMLIFIVSFSTSIAQIREDNKENSDRLDELRKQIEETSEKAQSLEKETQSIRQEISDIQRQLIKSAANIQTLEDEIYEKEANLRELRDTEVRLEESLKNKNFEMASTLGAMQRLSVQKTSVVAFKPDEAINTLRTTSLLKVILPDLRGRADLLEGDLSALSNVREDIIEQNKELRSELTKLVISNNEIDELLKKRTARQESLALSTKQERDKLRSFAENATDLQELIGQIEKEIALREDAAKRAQESLRDRPSGETGNTGIASVPIPRSTLNFASAKGNLPIPARGSINQVFGQMLTTGQRSKGIMIDTRPGATVIAPHEGRIEFAGKFRTYGQLLIISHGEGYHTLLAGMENINGIVGQWILKGEPIGQMNLDSRPSNSRQKLYVEFRERGKPINPLPWIVAMDRGGS